MEGALLSAVGLGFSYEKPVLSGFDLDAQPGSITVLVGLNGAGKTTALRLLSGQLTPESGRVRVNGQDPRRAAARRGLFYLPEVSDLPTHLSAREVVTFYLDLYGCPRMSRPSLTEILGSFGLGNVTKARVTTFSKGMRRRLELACLATVDPGVWLLDEPQAGLDPEGLRLLRGLCSEARERGRAVVMATHALVDVKALADHVMLLERGDVVFAGDRAALLERAGAREFVVTGGDDGLDQALVELAEGRGAQVDGPQVAVAALEQLFFSKDAGSEAGEP